MFVIANNESLRYDIYSGPFTKNDQLTASFYTDQFKFLPNIKQSVAQNVLGSMNKAASPQVPACQAPKSSANAIVGRDDAAYADRIHKAWVQDMYRRDVLERRNSDTVWKSPGYVTTDSCGPDPGDDTPHAALHYSELTHYVGSKPPSTDPDASVDFIVLGYIWPRACDTLNALGVTQKFDDAVIYGDLQSYQTMAIYAQDCWNGQDCSK
ncbi:hypothetical protein H0H87_008857 [Tephrocybe sp. NHM501043]|nr:hypothetical protein H0H87_008857 [Tephrocybe sp. NHM501043]